MAVLYRYRRAPVSRYVSVCTDYSAAAGGITPTQTDVRLIIQVTLVAADLPRVMQKRPMLARTDCYRFSRRGSARVMATKQPALDGCPHSDPPFRLALVCRRSLAGTRPGTARPDWDPLPF